MSYPTSSDWEEAISSVSIDSVSAETFEKSERTEKLLDTLGLEQGCLPDDQVSS